VPIAPVGGIVIGRKLSRSVSPVVEQQSGVLFDSLVEFGVDILVGAYL
jgi:hypothetical protein